MQKLLIAVTLFSVVLCLVQSRPSSQKRTKRDVGNRQLTLDNVKRGIQAQSFRATNQRARASLKARALKAISTRGGSHAKRLKTVSKRCLEGDESGIISGSDDTGEWYYDPLTGDSWGTTDEGDYWYHNDVTGIGGGTSEDGSWYAYTETTFSSGDGDGSYMWHDDTTMSGESYNAVDGSWYQYDGNGNSMGGDATGEWFYDASTGESWGSDHEGGSWYHNDETGTGGGTRADGSWYGYNADGSWYEYDEHGNSWGMDADGNEWHQSADGNALGASDFGSPGIGGLFKKRKFKTCKSNNGREVLVSTND